MSLPKKNAWFKVNLYKTAECRDVVLSSGWHQTESLSRLVNATAHLVYVTAQSILANSGLPRGRDRNLAVVNFWAVYIRAVGNMALARFSSMDSAAVFARPGWPEFDSRYTAPEPCRTQQRGTERKPGPVRLLCESHFVYSS